MSSLATCSTELRQCDSLGLGEGGVYQVVERIFSQHHIGGDIIVDLGCGVGNLSHIVGERFRHHIGVDLVKWRGMSKSVEFIQADLEKTTFPFSDQCADAVVAIEVIEHVENPRAFARELTRLARPNGWLLVSTPNQLSLLSKLTLLLKNEVNQFQERPGLYPAHLSALLEVDLRRIAKENGLRNVEIHYSDIGRIPFSPWKWPRGFGGQAFSDNVLMLARR
jgi:2-polyprenyl-3-methyl-5-hydroxy-6-metoxy-1,4-benzoquinol methylase